MPTFVKIDIDKSFRDIIEEIYFLMSESKLSEAEKELNEVSPEFEKFNVWIKKNAPFCANPKHFEKQISEDEFFKLKKKYNGEQISFIISQIENRKDLRKRYTNLYRTVLNWAKQSYG